MTIPLPLLWTVLLCGTISIDQLTGKPPSRKEMRKRTSQHFRGLPVIDFSLYFVCLYWIGGTSSKKSVISLVDLGGIIYLLSGRGSSMKGIRWSIYLKLNPNALIKVFSRTLYSPHTIQKFSHISMKLLSKPSWLQQNFVTHF